MNNSILLCSSRVVGAIILGLTLMTSACQPQKNAPTPPTDRPKSTSSAPSISPSLLKGTPMVKFETSLGDFTLELYPDKAPDTVKNFLGYVQEGFYDNTIFHRVIDGFMVQGGGFQTGMKEKSTRAPIKNEATNGLKNDLGTVAMARTQDPHSASAQFFINVKNNDFLNHTAQSLQGWGYAVFGKVVDGMDTVNKIKAVRTGQKGHHGDVPMEDVVVKKATIVTPAS